MCIRDSTERVKIAKHAKFDEGMNDIPLDQLPPNAMQLQRSEIGHRIPPDNQEIKSSDLIFTVSPFDKILTKEIRMSCNSHTFGLILRTDEINQRTYIENIAPNSSAGKSFDFAGLSKNRKREMRGSYITAINGNPVFDKNSIISEFQKIRKAIKNGTIDNFTIDIAPVPKLPRKTIWKECDEHDIFVPDPREDNSEASLSISTIKSITRLRTNETFDDFEPSYEEIVLAINALRSTEVTPEEQALGRYTRRKLKTLENWPQWSAGEQKQLDQFHDLSLIHI